MLNELLWSNKDRLGGKPCLRGTRFPLARVFAELSTGSTIYSIAEEYDLDLSQLEKIMNEFALLMNAPSPLTIHIA